MKAANSGARDLEAAPAAADEEQPEEFNVMYYYVYAFSIFVLAIGIFMYIWPGHGFVRWVCGTGLLTCGIFLMMNSDLVVTFIRLQREVGRFKENNKQFEKSIERQAAEVRRLRIAADAFDQIDQKFGGSVEKAAEMLESLEATAQSNITMNAKTMCRMYCDSDKDKQIDAGAEMDNAFDMLSSVFGGIYPKFQDRADKMKEGFNASPSFKKASAEGGGVKVGKFAEIFEMCLQPHKKDRPIECKCKDAGSFDSEMKAALMKGFAANAIGNFSTYDEKGLMLTGSDGSKIAAGTVPEADAFPIKVKYIHPIKIKLDIDDIPAQVAMEMAKSDDDW